MKTFKIDFEPLGKVASADKEDSIMNASINAGVDISSICGGKGKCGRCKIILKEGAATPITDAEKNMLSTDEIEKGFRLACQTKALSDLVVDIPPESLILSQRLQTEGEDLEVGVEPLIQKVFLGLDPPTLSDPRSDLTRVIDGIYERKGIKPSIDFILSKEISSILREGEWTVTTTLRENEIIGIEPGDVSGINLGMAFDIGSTKLAAYLVDLEAGNTLDAIGLANPQVAYGDDIVSRIGYAMEGDRKRRSETCDHKRHKWHDRKFMPAKRD